MIQGDCQDPCLLLWFFLHCLLTYAQTPIVPSQHYNSSYFWFWFSFLYWFQICMNEWIYRCDTSIPINWLLLLLLLLLLIWKHQIYHHNLLSQYPSSGDTFCSLKDCCLFDLSLLPDHILSVKYVTNFSKILEVCILPQMMVIVCLSERLISVFIEII